jgi:choline kinase
LRDDLTAVILLAGEGTRLRPHTLHSPKCLLEVGDRSLLDRELAAIEAAGIRRVVLVTGYRAADIDAFVARYRGGLQIQTIFNAEYASTNNACSLLRSRDVVSGGIILFDGDLLFETAVLERLLRSQGDVALAVDVRRELGDEEMKVTLKPDGTIASVNKQNPPASSIGESIGIARFSAEAARELYRRIGAQVASGLVTQFYEKAFEEMIAADLPFHVCDVHGLACMEIDTPDDLERARSLAEQPVFSRRKSA